MDNRMRFGSSMHILYNNIMTDTRNSDDLARESVYLIRLNYTHYRKSKVKFNEILDENVASKYVIHTLHLMEE